MGAGLSVFEVGAHNTVFVNLKETRVGSSLFRKHNAKHNNYESIYTFHYV